MQTVCALKAYLAHGIICRGHVQVSLKKPFIPGSEGSCQAPLKWGGVYDMGATGAQVSDLCREAIQQAIRHAAASGDTLFVASVAKTIAMRYGASPKEIAEQLTESGIRAGLTMQFGSPE